MPSVGLFMFMYLLSFYLVISSDDWFMMWMGLEINMLSFIMLMYRQYNQKCMESCLKYFFIQSLGSGIFISFFYLDKYFLSDVMVIILGFKIGAAPLYYWFPSVCMGISWMSSYLLMTVQKIIPLMLIIMFLSWMVWLMIWMSLIVGVLGSFNQSSLKQLMAYSSIHHLGWIFLCNSYSDMTWVLYLLVYFFVLISIFYIFMKKEVLYYIILSKVKVKFWFSVGMLSLSGMPPLLGFFLSFFVFIFFGEMSMFMLLMLVLMSVIMFYVYFRLIYDVYMCYKMCNSYMNQWDMIDYDFMIDWLGMMGLLLSLMMMILLI